jgi:hypothetical protein
MSAREIYESSIRQLPAIDRLRLASLILDELAASQGEGLDIQDGWSEQDLADLSKASLKHAATSIGEDDANA